MSSVGESSRRKEGPEKLTGAAKYIDDYELPGCLHGVTLRSSIARGAIRDIRFDPDFPWEDVVVVTATSQAADSAKRMKNWRLIAK